MKSVIRRNGLYLSAHGLSFVKGTWTRSVYSARKFHTKREALEYLASSDLPHDECTVLSAHDCYYEERDKDDVRKLKRHGFSKNS